MKHFGSASKFWKRPPRCARPSPHLISVGFAGVEPTVAWSGDFRCWRREGEDEDRFMARAHAEARAVDPRPLQVLIFFGDDDDGDPFNATRYIRP
jgi:hypothetical protein